MIQFHTNISEKGFKVLENFLYHHSYSNFFQSTIAYQFFKAVDNYEPFMIVAQDGDKIAGSLLAVVIKESGGLKGFFSRRCIVWGGPLVHRDDLRIWSGLLDALDRLVSAKAIYCEFRNFRDLADKKTLFFKSGYHYLDHLNYIVPISSLDKARSSLSKSKKRQINKSLNSGAKIIEAESIDQVRNFYAVLETLYKEKIKKPLPTFDFFSEFFRNKKLGVFLLVMYKGSIIGGIMCPIYKNTIYEWYVCGLDGEIKNIYPSVLATWAPILYAADNKLAYFDFMGAGRPDRDYGVREFKSKFGGNGVNFGRFVRINQKIYYQIGKLGLEISKRIH